MAFAITDVTNNENGFEEYLDVKVLKYSFEAGTPI